MMNTSPQRVLDYFWSIVPAIINIKPGRDFEQRSQHKSVDETQRYCMAAAKEVMDDIFEEMIPTCFAPTISGYDH